MTRIHRLIDRLITREPVVFWSVVGLWVGITFDVDPESRAGLAIAATVILFQRAFSESKKTSDENVEAAKYVGAVEKEAELGVIPSQEDGTG